MKRLLSFLLLSCLLLTSCSQKTDAPSATAPTWQEQYDLGVRYLSEGNYEEAIIAFTAAIEIDAKLPEAYIGMADVYIQQGEYYKAYAILEDGLEQSGDNEMIVNKLKNWQNGVYRPLNAYGGIEFIHRPSYYQFGSLPAADQEFIAAFANAAITNDTDAAKALLGYEMKGRVSTLWNGYKIEIYSSGETFTDDGDRSVSAKIEMRPENGTGYIYYFHCIEAIASKSEDSWYDALSIHRTICPCVDWQWNGTMNYTEDRFHYTTWSDGATCNSTRHYTLSGSIVDNLRDGTFTAERHDTSEWSALPKYNEDNRYTETIVFQNGTFISRVGDMTGQVFNDGALVSIEGVNYSSLDSLGWLFW